MRLINRGENISSIEESILETAKGMHKAGVINDKRLEWYKTICELKLSNLWWRWIKRPIKYYIQQRERELTRLRNLAIQDKTDNPEWKYWY